jgi:acetyl/propionyl-CoA carboxylase alpha subunit
MGDKARARRIADKVGVPTIAGDSRGFTDAKEALAVAETVGFPILLKACAGGGGRGMKIVNDPANFVDTFQTAGAEVLAAFGDASLLVEKYLPRVRHVEVQIAGDRFQNVISLGCRDCSVQRRYQKLIEESPPFALDPKIVQSLQDAAVEIGKAVNYTNVGTIEFLVDIETNKHYFIEMNTRLQVEHPVTEMVTGLDLVRLQIIVAQGDKLPFTQADIKQRGHAIEVRLYAEDPDNGFLPSIGKIKKIGKIYKSLR